MGDKYVVVVIALIALTYIVVGYITKVRPPREINPLYGYRTKRSKKNQSSWDFAQKHSAIWMIYTGVILMVIAGGSYFIKSYNSAAITFLIAGTLVISLLPIFVTEYTLNQRF